MSKKAALDAAKYILNGPRIVEATRLNRIADAMRPCGPYDTPRVEIPSDAPDSLKRLARKSSTNVLPLVVDTFSQGMKVDGYYSPGSPDNAAPWEWWQRNGWDARQTGVHHAALQYGTAYETVLPGDTGPVWKGVSPRAMTALYGEADDEWPVIALHVKLDGSMCLYDEEMAYRFGLESALPKGVKITDPAMTVVVNGLSLVYIDQQAHGVGVPPVVRFRDRMLLDGEEHHGIVEPLISIQNRIDETTFGMLVTQYFAAFKQRYVIGWVPESEADAMKAAASDAWYFDDPDVKVGQFQESDLTRYIESKKSGMRDLAAIAQLPAQNLGIDGISNISDATLAGLETAKNRRTDEMATSIGESHEQAFRLAAHIAGDATAAADYQAEVKWKDSTARSFAQTVDGLGKLATMLGVPPELLWEDIPGWTQQKVDRAKALLAEQPDPIGSLAATLDRQANGLSTA
jgi:hypothetical protein